jgi:hypothetical protein
VSSQGDDGLPDAIAQEFASARRGFNVRRLWYAKSIDEKDSDLVNTYTAAQRTFFSSLSLEEDSLVGDKASRIPAEDVHRARHKPS